MIIETFEPDKVEQVYERFAKKGRLLPKGVTYINSWVDMELSTCYQVMEAAHQELIEEWTSNWEDLASFKIIPVLESRQASKLFTSS